MRSNAPKYTQAQLGVLRKALLAILAGDVPKPAYGLCGNLTYHTHVVEFNGRTCGWSVGGYEFVAEEAKEWPHAIRGEDGELRDWFVPLTRGQGMWEGENLKRRQNLIQYLLGRVAHHEAMLRGGVALAD